MASCLQQMASTQTFCTCPLQHYANSLKKYFHPPKYLPTTTNTVDHEILLTLLSSGADGSDADRPDVGGAHADSEGAEDAFPGAAGTQARRALMQAARAWMASCL